MQNFLNTARINLIVGNRSKFKTDLYQLHRHTSTRLVRSSVTDETQQRKRESNKRILVLSLLRMYATCALIPGEDIKNKCVPFPVFMFMMLRSSLNLQLCLKISLYYAQYFTVFETLSGSLQLDYKVNSTGTEDNSVLLKFVSFVHIFTIKKKNNKKKVIQPPPSLPGCFHSAPSRCLFFCPHLIFQL